MGKWIHFPLFGNVFPACHCWKITIISGTVFTGWYDVHCFTVRWNCSGMIRKQYQPIWPNLVCVNSFVDPFMCIIDPCLSIILHSLPYLLSNCGMKCMITAVSALCPDIDVDDNPFGANDWAYCCVKHKLLLMTVFFNLPSLNLLKLSV